MKQLIILSIVLTTMQAQELMTLWHNGQVQKFQGTPQLAIQKYYAISSSFAKCIVSHKQILDWSGGSYRLMAVGYAIEIGFLTPRTKNIYFVSWDLGTFDTQSEDEANTKYDSIPPNRAFLKNGKLIKSEGTDKGRLTIIAKAAVYA